MLLYVCVCSWPVRTLSFNHDSNLLASASEDLLIDIVRTCIVNSFVNCFDEIDSALNACHMTIWVATCTLAVILRTV